MIAKIMLGIALLCSAALAKEIIPATLPAGIGVNIHFTDPRPGEMKMLADAGFKFVRMDFDWAATEKQKGIYNFSAYERLLAALDEHQIRALFILDYANPLYDENQSPHTEEGRNAFGKWAAAAAKHFQNRGILWEMYNEPNISPFWRPKPNPDDYVKLALEVGRALREAAPSEIYIGPACSRIDLPFLEICFKAGLLEYFAAVSVHPYRQTNPETVEADYRNLRRLIAQHAPAGKDIPIFSGEWGYSSIWAGFDPDKQGIHLARQFLLNQSQQIPLSIWYDWHDDGPKPDEPEHHFGTVLYEYHEGKDPIYASKPAYRAAKALTTLLSGYRFNKRLAVGKCGPAGCDFDYVLLFQKGNDVRLVAWSTVPKPHDVTIPASAGTFTIYDHLGEKKHEQEADDTGLVLNMSESPQYIVPAKPNDLLRVATAWERAPLEIVTKSTQITRLNSQLRNPLDRRIRISSTSAGPSATQWVNPGAMISLPARIGLLRDGKPMAVPLVLRVGEEPELRQVVHFIATDALDITVFPPALGKLPIQIKNPTGDAFTGFVQVNLYPIESDRRVKPIEVTQDLQLTQGQLEQLVSIPVPDGLAMHIEIVEGPNRRFSVTRNRHYSSINLAARDFEVVAGGDDQVKSQQSISDEPAAPDLPPVPIPSVMKITYDFDSGWKFLCIKPRDKTSVIRRIPTALCVWVRGDGSGNIVRARSIDSTQQIFQVDGPALTDQKWRYIEFPFDGSSGATWGGAKDGVIHDPVRVETLFLIDSADRKQSSGTVYLANPTLIYGN